MVTTSTLPLPTLTLPALPCGCTPQTRCAWAWDIRDAFATTPPPLRRQLATAYTAHCRALGELAGRAPGTEMWPQWAETDHPDPRTGATP